MATLTANGIKVTYTLTNTGTTYKIQVNSVYCPKKTNAYSYMFHVCTDKTDLDRADDTVVDSDLRGYVLCGGAGVPKNLGPSTDYPTDGSGRDWAKTWTKTTRAQTFYLALFYSNDEYGILLDTKPAAFVTITVPALATYAITYNANGGSGAPATQTKTYGKSLTLSSAKPSRTNAVFVKWNTKADGTGTSYNLGQSYTANAALTLYAIWVPKPQVTSLTVVRCDENGNDDDEGTYCRVVGTWSLDDAINPDVDSATVTGTIAPQVGTAEDEKDITELLDGATSGTGGTVTALVDDLNTDMQYTVTITATAGTQATSRSAILTRAFFIMDFKKGGKALGIGRAAPEDGLSVGFETTFDQPVFLRENATSAAGRGYILTDRTGFPYPALLDNGANLLIGLEGKPGRHHTGGTVISAGYNDGSSSGNPTAYIDVPNAANDDSSRYGIWHGGNLPQTAWANFPLNSACEAYDSAQTPKYRKTGGIVNVCGAVKPTAAVAAQGTMTIGVLPAGFRPVVELHMVGQGSGTCIWDILVGPSGTITMRRYRNENGYQQAPTSAWLPFNITFAHA